MIETSFGSELKAGLAPVKLTVSVKLIEISCLVYLFFHQFLSFLETTTMEATTSYMDSSSTQSTSNATMVDDAMNDTLTNSSDTTAEFSTTRPTVHTSTLEITSMSQSSTYTLKKYQCHL